MTRGLCGQPPLLPALHLIVAGLLAEEACSAAGDRLDRDQRARDPSESKAPCEYVSFRGTRDAAACQRFGLPHGGSISAADDDATPSVCTSPN